MWQFSGVTSDAQAFLIKGLDVWAFKWRRVAGEAEVEDPLYGQPHTFAVYTITDGTQTVKFAAGEFSAGAWGFYLPL
ncbi:hypothetical protein BH24DEI2_BH24DEI2_13930 [soil metagenome]